MLDLKKEYPYFNPILESVNNNIKSTNKDDLIQKSTDEILKHKWEDMPIGTVFQDSNYYRYGIVIGHKWGIVDIAFLYPRKLTFNTARNKCVDTRHGSYYNFKKVLPSVFDTENCPNFTVWNFSIPSKSDFEAYISPYVDKLLMDGPFWTTTNSYAFDDKTKWLTNGISAFKSEYHKVVYIMSLEEF